MFGSDDDKKTPAAAGEKKDLFGWLRKKPQDKPAEQPLQPDAEASAMPIAKTPAPLSDATPGETRPRAEEPAPPAPAVEKKNPFAWLGIKSQATSDAATKPAAEASGEPEPLAPASPEAVPEAEIAPVPTESGGTAPLEAPAEAAVEVSAEPAKAGFFARFKGGAAPAADESAPLSAAETQASFFARLKQGLSKTSASLGEGMASLFLGKKAIDDDLLDEIETRLLTADVGVEATSAIVQSLTKRVARKELADSGALYKALQEELAALLKPVEQPLAIDVGKQPYVILVVGVNGAGKTTTIGKLARKLQLEGKKVMLAAGDTFRAAAVEQLQVWGERNQIPVIAQHTGADSASVIFDAVQAAKARGVDVLIADTAGRLHTKDNLMEELKKVRRVIGKLDETAPHEVLLVLDAGTGQNAINQAKQFNQAVQLSGLALTKLDGTAKGGVIFALAKQFGLPIRYIGVGEGIDDLRTFAANDFVQALFAEKQAG
jgi:fused signal recognition particle receptor